MAGAESENLWSAKARSNRAAATEVAMKKIEVGQVWQVGDRLVMVSSVSSRKVLVGKAEKRGATMPSLGRQLRLASDGFKAAARLYVILRRNGLRPERDVMEKIEILTTNSKRSSPNGAIGGLRLD